MGPLTSVSKVNYWFEPVLFTQRLQTHIYAPALPSTMDHGVCKGICNVNYIWENVRQTHAHTSCGSIGRAASQEPVSSPSFFFFMTVEPPNKKKNQTTASNHSIKIQFGKMSAMSVIWHNRKGRVNGLRCKEMKRWGQRHWLMRAEGCESRKVMRE